MKRFLHTTNILIAALSAAVMAVSCASDEPMMTFWSEYGVVSYVGGDEYFEIADDDGVYYIVENNTVSDEGIAEGKRLFFAYYDYVDVTGNPSLRLDLQSKERVLEVRLEQIDYVLSKPIIRESFILEDEAIRRDSIGHDGIRPYGKEKAWFGGNFLNISFEYTRYKGSDTRHLINLVWDDVRIPEGEEDDYVHLYLRHNAYGELPSISDIDEKDTGVCSFDLSELIPEGKDNIKVKLFWDEYNEPSIETTEYFEDMGTFTLPGNSITGSGTDSDTGYYISPPANHTAFVM
jgi:hypothetical protein